MADRQEGPQTLSPSQTARGLRAFITQSVLQGAWSRAFGINTVVYSGFALSLGASPSDIAFLTALASLACLIQLVAIRFTSRIKRRKAFVVGCGCVEMFLRFAPILIPLVLLKSFHVPAIYFCVLSALIFTHLRAPLLNDWLALTTPEGYRGRFISQRWLWLTLMMIIAGFTYGVILDQYPETGDGGRYGGFVWTFIIALIAGWGSYLALVAAPAPRVEEDADGGTLEAIATVLRDTKFRRLLTFRAVVQFSTALAMPFFSVFMIKELGLSYTTMALYGNIALVTVLLSNRPVGGLVDRFGSKPVMQVLFIPGIIAPVLWAWAPGLHLLVPLAMIIGNLMHTSVKLSGVPLLWDAIPQRGNRAPYFAVWSVSIHLAAFAGAAAGGILASVLETVPLEWGGVRLSNIQVIFLLTALLRAVPLVLLRHVEEKKAQSATRLVTQVRKGNALTYTFNAFVMNFFTREGIRAWAATGMARSGSPMAAEDLIHALDDISPQVRRRAAEGLGMLGAEEGAGPLMEQMENRDSDIRAEAAEALGKIQHPLSLDALRHAMSDRDSRVRISAIRALGEVGGEGVREYLHESMTGDFDRQAFPTFIDVLSRLGERRIVALAGRRLHEYDSPVIRAQLLNSICRALGAGESFYQLAILDEYKQATRIVSTLEKARKDLDAIGAHVRPLRGAASSALAKALTDCEEGHYRDACRELVAVAREVSAHAKPIIASERSGQGNQTGRDAVEGLAELARVEWPDGGSQQEALFVTVCLGQLLVDLRAEAGA